MQTAIVLIAALWFARFVSAQFLSCLWRGVTLDHDMFRMPPMTQDGDVNFTPNSYSISFKFQEP